MSNTRHLIPLTGLAGTFVLAAYMVAQLHAQTTAPVLDYTNAAIAEVRDGQGQILLSGKFVVTDEPDDDDVERKAALQAVGADSDAIGQAEVEFAKSAPVKQELEFSVRNVAPGTSVTFHIDGQVVGQATVDRRGRAEWEVDVPLP